MLPTQGDDGGAADVLMGVVLKKAPPAVVGPNRGILGLLGFEALEVDHDVQEDTCNCSQTESAELKRFTGSEGRAAGTDHEDRRDNNEDLGVVHIDPRFHHVTDTDGRDHSEEKDRDATDDRCGDRLNHTGKLWNHRENERENCGDAHNIGVVHAG